MCVCFLVDLQDILGRIRGKKKLGSSWFLFCIVDCVFDEIGSIC